MKKKLFFNIIILTSISQTMVGMNGKQLSIVEEEGNNHSVNPFDTVNYPVKDFQQPERKSSFFTENSNDDIQADLADLEQKSKSTFGDSFKNFFSNSANILCKTIGQKDITAETEEETKHNLSRLSKIQSGKEFINDWNNNSPCSNMPSFLKKSNDRAYWNQNKVINGIYFMQKTDSYDVKSLLEIKKSIGKLQAYQRAVSTVCNRQYQMIEERISEKLNTGNSLAIIENNTNNDKKDEENN